VIFFELEAFVGFLELVSPPHISLHNFCVDRQPSSTFHYSNMVQIKISIAFVLAAAAIAPIVAQPIAREGSEIEARDYFSGQAGLNFLSSLENEEKTLLSEDAKLKKEHALLVGENGQLEKTDKSLKLKEDHLKKKNHQLEREDEKLLHKHRKLEKEDGALEHKKHRLEGEDAMLDGKRKSLEATDKKLYGKKSYLEGKNKDLRKKINKLDAKEELLGKKDRKLELIGKVQDRKNKILAKKGDVLAKQDKALAQEGTALLHLDKALTPKILKPVNKLPVVHSKVSLVTRESAGFEDMFERGPENEESDASTPRLNPFMGGPGPAIPSHRQPSRAITMPRFRLPYGGHGPVILPNSGLFKPNRIRYGGIRVPHRRHSGLIPASVAQWFPQRQFEHSGLKPAQPRIMVGREYVESEDMFERDLVEDAEFDAREFDDGLYLD